MQRLEDGLGRIAAAHHRRPRRALLVALVLAAAGLVSAARLTLDANLVDLLPGTFQSVKDIATLEERFGGAGWLVVVGEGAEPEALRQFARDLAPRLEALESITFVEYQRPREFFSDRALFYLPANDLEELHRRLEARVKYELLQRNPLYLDLEDTPPPSLDWSDLGANAQPSARRLTGAGEAFYLDPVARRVVLLAKPTSNSADLGFARRLVDEVEAVLATVDPSRYGPGFHTAVTGAYKKKLDQQAQLARDIGVSSMAALAVLLAYLLLHFRSAVTVGLGLAPVGVGLAWIYGAVGVSFGSVNLLTGFLGAILGGLGIEHGIHLLTRYFALRAEGQSSEDATRASFTHTGGSALVSALVAALTFFSLAISEFRAFREFGLIAGAGMLALLAAYVLVLPALLGLAHRLGWTPPRPRDPAGARSRVVRALPHLRWPAAFGMSAMVLGFVPQGRALTFDYDFAALEDHRLPSFELDKEVNRLLGYSQTPVIILTQSPQQERGAVEELARRKQALGERSTIDFAAALDDLVPRDQEARRPALARINALLAKVNPDTLDASTRKRFEALARAARAAPFTREDLPVSIKRQFQGLGHDQSGFVLVFPRIKLTDGDRVRDLAREVRGLRGPDGGTLSAAGEAMVLADILEMVTREGPTILFIALLAVFAAMRLTLGSFLRAALCLTPTVLSMFALVGLMPLMGLRFNYLNILVLPVLIGTTVDAGVHLLSRLGDVRRQHFTRAYVETARAISGGLLTSAVGFSALLLADHPGLNSVGRLANLGFATNLLITLVGFPALLLALSRRRWDRVEVGGSAEPASVGAMMTTPVLTAALAFTSLTAEGAPASGHPDRRIDEDPSEVRRTVGKP